MREGSRPARGRHVAEHHRSLGVRILRRAVGVVAAVTALAVVAGVVAYFRLQGNIDTINLAEIAGNNRPQNTAAADPETNLPPMNILLMGSDTRAGLEDASEFGGDDMGGERSDTTLLVHLSANRKSATVASIPRDSMVRSRAARTPTPRSRVPRR